MPKQTVSAEQIDEAILELSAFSGATGQLPDRKRHVYRNTASDIVNAIDGALYDDRLTEHSSYDDVCRVVKSSLGMFVVWFVGKQVIYWLAGILWRKMFPEIDLGWQSSGVGAVASNDQNR